MKKDVCIDVEYPESDLIYNILKSGEDHNAIDMHRQGDGSIKVCATNKEDLSNVLLEIDSKLGKIERWRNLYERELLKRLE